MYPIATTLSCHKEVLRDFFLLLKPRVMSLVIFTGLAGAITAPKELDSFSLVITMLCIAVGAGAAGALNMWYEHDIDILMKRTAQRPIPQKRIHPHSALIFGLTLTILAIVVMGIMINWLAAFLLAFASFVYVFIYTIWLKRKTPQNIVIGGISGALPPMIGWVAVTGTVDIPAILLFLIIFLWTPPHFWALALVCQRDYERAQIPMLPLVVSKQQTYRQILFYTLILWPVSVAPVFFDLGGLLYAVCSMILGGIFVFYALYIQRTESLQTAKHMFTFSIVHLFLLFTLLMSYEFIK